MALQQAEKRSSGSSEEAVFPDGMNCVLGAGRREPTAGRQQRRNEPAVSFDQTDRHKPSGPLHSSRQVMISKLQNPAPTRGLFTP